MKTTTRTMTRTRLATAISFIVLAVTTILLPTARASDIDIFGGSGGSATPNILILVDNTSSNDAAFTSTCPFTGAPANLPNSNLLDMVYCALYGAVDAIKTQPALLGKLNVGLMVGGSGSNKGGQFYVPSSSPYNLPLMDAAGIQTFENTIIGGIPKATGNAKLDGDMTEVWAWVSGNTGPRSGTSYSAHVGTLSCQKTYLIVIGAASKQGRPCNGSGCSSASELGTAGATAAQQVQINTGTIGPNTGDDGSWVDEWARFLYQSDFNSNASDPQNVVTYTIAAGGNVADYVQLLQSTANVGGGKAFVGTDYTSMANAILAIFNEVAAVNSVFASPSLPTSSLAQGAYQNQVYLGMFRPDANGNPRWMGNLKQYQFGVGGTTANPTLFLADATGTAAISSTTGFISPSAVSFWTSKNSATLPDNLSSTGGFWLKDQQGAGNGFDSPDGEVVEKGGIGQQIRIANLQDNYTTNPSSPRNVYTTCTGTCTAGSSLSVTPFATTNGNLTSAVLGLSGTASSVSSISRSGTTVTMTLTAAPSTALVNGQTVTVTGATNSEVNGTFTINLVSSTSFTYTIVESPPTPSTGTYTASIASSPISITSLTRSGSTTATATTAAAHGFVVGQSVTIIGASQIEFNGAVTILTVPTSTTFTYQITPGPTTPATSPGNADIGASHTNSITLTGISRGSIGASSPFSATVTATTSSRVPGAYAVGATVNISNAVPGAYDGSYTIASVAGNGKSFTFTINTSPTSPATGTMSADPSASVAIAAGGLVHTTSCTGASPTPNVTVTATTSSTLPASFSTGAHVNITGSGGTNESKYTGSNISITKTGTTTFTYAVTTSPPCSPSATNVSVVTSSGTISAASLINWVRGDDTLGDEPSPDPGVITIRPSVHGDVIHSRPVVVNYSSLSSVVVFYGSNDGMFHAINGNQPSGSSIGSTAPGQELWSFVAPEFFTKLSRLYLNSPQVQFATTPTSLVPTPTPKDYFFDGTAAVYQNGATTYLFLSTRRGGRFIYALDVSDPTNPKFLWKKSNSDMAELGYTWSTPTPALVRGYANPVLIFGGGYDPNEDNEPPTADTMGRGIFVLDATNGNLVWSATFGVGGTGTCTGTCTLTDMTYGIAADVAMLNRDSDAAGYVDRLYAADLGGNIWRVDLEPAGYTTTGARDSPSPNQVGPSTWQITKFASLGGTGTTKRKFLYPPDVVTTSLFDMVLGGTGDREHPLYGNSSQAYGIMNRFYGLKDANVGASVPSGWSTSGSTPGTNAPIVDATSSTADNVVSGLTTIAANSTTTTLPSNNGFYFTFPNAGEKAVNAPTTVTGYTFIGTSTPTSPSSLTCNNLGTGRGYQFNFLTGANSNVVFTTPGLPPSPVAGVVSVTLNGTNLLVPFCMGCGDPSASQNGGSADAFSSLGTTSESRFLGRSRIYWYLDKHDN